MIPDCKGLISVRIFIKVDFPAPFYPNKPSILLEVIYKLMLFRTYF